MLAVTRGNDKVQDLYNEMPSIYLYQMICYKICKRRGVTTSICGQAGSKKSW